MTRFVGLTKRRRRSRVAIERTIEHWRALPWLSVREASAVLGFGVDFVRTLLKQNKLEARQICGKTFVIVTSVRRFMDEEVESVAASGPRPLSSSERKTVRNIREGLG